MSSVIWEQAGKQVRTESGDEASSVKLVKKKSTGLRLRLNPFLV